MDSISVNDLELLNSVEHYRVLFCGESITDTYRYVRPLGRPTKDAIVSVELTHYQTFEGGITAAANHARDLVSKVDIHTGGQHIEKVRYVEGSHNRKLFNVYLPPLLEVPATRPRYLNQYEVVAVIDYGHGMANADFLDEINAARYLAINVQTNSGNYGFNLATKYKYADYLCVDEAEARLATQNKDGPIRWSVDALKRVARVVVITMGKAGAIGYSEASGLVEVPAFTDRVVDTMGAGDAFFAVTACIAKKADMLSLLRIGNAAGAIKSQILGHSGKVTKNALIDYLTRLR